MPDVNACKRAGGGDGRDPQGRRAGGTGVHRDRVACDQRARQRLGGNSGTHSRRCRAAALRAGQWRTQSQHRPHAHHRRAAPGPVRRILLGNHSRHRSGGARSGPAPAAVGCARLGRGSGARHPRAQGPGRWMLIMSPYADAAFLEEHSAADTPAVLMNTPVRGYGHSAFCIDNRGGARVMVSHLASIGHRRIAFISGPADNFDATERLAGYREALRELGLEAGERVLPGDFSEESGYRAAQSLLTPQGREWPDAVFAANDMMALGSLFAFNEAHVGVPTDIALAGVDDIPMARFVSPPLTTVRVRMAELGARALERLAAAIEAPDVAPTTTETVPAELVVRASCGARPPPASERRPIRSGRES